MVYRLGFARSRPMARQMVNHGHVRVNGRTVNIPSYLVRPGEGVALAETATQMPAVIEEMEANRPVPDWLQRQGAGGRVLRLPEREDMDLPIEEDRIIAYYSR